MSTTKAFWDEFLQDMENTNKQQVDFLLGYETSYEIKDLKEMENYLKDYKHEIMREETFGLVICHFGYYLYKMIRKARKGNMYWGYPNGVENSSDLTLNIVLFADHTVSIKPMVRIARAYMKGDSIVEFYKYVRSVDKKQMKQQIKLAQKNPEEARKQGIHANLENSVFDTFYSS